MEVRFDQIGDGEVIYAFPSDIKFMKPVWGGIVGPLGLIIYLGIYYSTAGAFFNDLAIIYFTNLKS